MARTVPRMRCGGVVRLRRAGRWRWAWLTLGGLAVILPFALSLAVLLPPVILAIPPVALWVALWTLFRRLDDAAPPPGASSPPSGLARVIPLRRPRRA